MPTGAPLRRGAPLIAATAYHVIGASSSATRSSSETNGGEETQQEMVKLQLEAYFKNCHDVMELAVTLSSAFLALSQLNKCVPQ